MSAADVGWDSVEFLARFDFADHIERYWDLRQVRGPHRITIARRSRKRRKVAIGEHRFGQRAAWRSKQIHGFPAASLNLDLDQRGLLLDHSAGIFKAQDRGADWRGGHGEMIRQRTKEASRAG